MRSTFVLLATCFVALGSASVLPQDPPGLDDEDLYTVPKGFLLGAGLSATQAEGGWNLHGKAESVMDRMVHTQPNPIFGADNVDVAADHYNRYKEDLALAKEMKFTSHRFSISWSRVLPTGDAKQPNPEGVQFYHDYIDEVKRLGMEPMVTMVHFDQPFTLEEETGGWEHPEMAVKYVEYADFLFATFGDKVKYWNTINEPNMYCNYFPTIMYQIGIRPKSDNNIYKCSHNIIIAHMRTYHLYKERYHSTQKGFVGTSALLWATTPASTRTEDVLAADLFVDVTAGVILHPLVHGDYPPAVRVLIDERSAAMGLPESRLPHFTEEEKSKLAGGVTDFIALNVYSRFVIAHRHNASDGAPLPALLGPVTADMPNIKQVDADDVAFDVVDEFMMQDAVLRTWQNYHIPIIISENGMADMQNKMGLKDTARAAYHSVNLRSLVRSMKEYGVNVIGYYAWALLDLFEFSAGYQDRPFGLVHVDYASGSLDRTLKDSSKFFIEVANTGRVPFVATPTPDTSSAAPTTPAAPTTAAHRTTARPPRTTPQPSGSSASSASWSMLLSLILVLSVRQPLSLGL